MSFWSKLKPQTKPMAIAAASVMESGSAVDFLFDDLRRAQLTAPALRRACPCAECVEEWTGKQLLAPGAVDDSVTVQGAFPVGNYAWTFRFSDRHQTGIYTFELLAKLTGQATVGT